MKIPKSLKVGGIIYKIEKKRVLDKGENKFSGVAKHRQAIIKIALYDNEGELYDKRKLEECFIHEILHCVDDIYNNQKLDEDMVERLSQGLYQVLKDNKLLVDFHKEG